jgi:STIP1 family protein 1
VKGHYLLGLALLRCDDADEAVRHLDKALDLARGGNGGPTMVEDVWQELSNAKFKQWDLAASDRRERQRGLR